MPPRTGSLSSGQEAAAASAKANPKRTGLKTPHYKTEKQTKAPRRKLLDALDVAGFGSVDADSITFVDERWNVYDETGFQSGRLHDGAGSGFLESGLGLDDFEIHGI